MDIFMNAIGLAVLCYSLFGVWIYGNQRKILYAPFREHASKASDIGLEFEDIRFRNSLGSLLHAWWFPHEQARYTILFCHGNKGNISHLSETVELMHRLNLSLLLYDYSGYGQSEGRPSEQATQADALAAWNYLVEGKGVAPNRIIVFGRSLGGAVAAQLVSCLAEAGVSPAGLVLESTFTSIPDIGAFRYPWLPIRQLSRFRYDSVVALHDLKIPTLFAHSKEDRVVPYSFGQTLYESYQGPKSFFDLEGNHNSGFKTMGVKYENGLESYLLSLESDFGSLHKCTKMLQD